ncbi:hypothetical protein BKA65DRAFT_123437 [Rhexocercosporidium sp. MPI-PUGE-AT-0058]|nr:hypothetical protein BKA65DRAFT_123437 [Rhexocercosporidium sp. MPI-PUGE-AT-0058]
MFGKHRVDFDCRSRSPRQTSITTRQTMCSHLGGFQKYTLWLQNMAPAIDVAVNASSGIACPVWAPIKYILKLSKDHFDALERILRMIETVSDCLPRLRIYEKLNKHPALQTSFLQLFTSIIDFSVLTLRYLNRNAFSRVMRHVGRDFESQFGDVLDSLRRHARAVDEMALATELQQAAQYRQKSEKVYHHDLQIRCSEWLRPSNVREVHTRQSNERLAGTCQWILEHPEFSAWSSTSPSAVGQNRLLLICGNPGCGKSILASSIVEHVESRAKNVLFFPFSNMDTTREGLQDLVRYLLWQALVAADEKECWEIIHRLMSKGPAISTELWDALASILKHGQKPWYLIIDGVDECSQLDGLLRDRIPGLLQSNENLRAAVLGRPQILQHRTALPSSYLIQITPKMLKKDISCYVSESVNNAALLRDHRSKALMMEALMKQSEGMFLWVRLMIQDLQNSTSAAEAHQRLHCLPRGLAESYRQVLRHIHESARDDSSRICLVRNVLAFATACRRPLSYQELRYALAMDMRYRMGRLPQPLEDFLPQHSAEQLVDLCSNLISISNNQVLLIHASLKEFITELFEKPISKTGPQVLDLCLKSEETHGLFAKVCLEYLQLGDYGRPWQDAFCLPDLRRQNPFLEYASKNLLYHISSTGAPCPLLLDDIFEFIQSRFFVSWTEHFHLDLTGDFLAVLVDFDNFISWLSGSRKQEELHAEIRAALDKELEDRLRVSNVNTSSTERWIEFTAVASEYLIPQHPEFSTGTTRSQIEQYPAVIPPIPLITRRRRPLLDVEALARRTMRLIEDNNPTISVTPHTQMDMVLKVLSIVTVAKRLTDPIELLFKLLLRKADSVPVYALYEIAKFYFRVGQEQRGLQVAQHALEKVAGRDIAHEFMLLNFLANFHDKRYEYDQAIPYMERHISGLIRQRGKVDSDVAKIKISLGIALNRLDRLTEAEAIFLELVDLESRSQFLKDKQIYSIYKGMRDCRYDIQDYEGAMIWLQRAMKLPYFALSNSNYQDGTFMGALLFETGRYEEALACFENPNKLQQQRGITHQLEICQRRYWQGVTLLSLGRWNESLSLLRQALSDRDKVNEKVTIHRKLRIVSKLEILAFIYEFASKCLHLGKYQLSLDSFQTATLGFISSPEVERNRILYSTFFTAASCYGLGEFQQGLKLLQSIVQEFNSYYENNWEALLEFKYLVGFGAAQLKTSARFDVKTDSSSQTLAPFGLKKQRSLDDIRDTKFSMGRDHEWRYMLHLTEFSRDDFKDLF